MPLLRIENEEGREVTSPLLTREVSCLFATREDKVLLSTKDGEHWHFPQEEIRRDAEGRPTETPLDAIKRIVDKFDDLEEEDIIIESTKQHHSHKGERTEYHIFITPSKLLNGELRSNGTKYEWAPDPHSFNLNECTREKIKEYGFHPIEKT